MTAVGTHSLEPVQYKVGISSTYTPVAGKLGGKLNLAVWRSTFATAKLKSANILYLLYIIMVIPY